MQPQHPTLVLASGNAGKLRELQELLAGRFTLVSMRDMGVTGELPETGDTFAENATQKAEAVSRATGLPALADDSGLSVSALGGAPGVRSARYAGMHGDDAANNALLMRNMAGIENRAAKFVCAIALATPSETTRVFTGECPGVITRAPRGANGFGYDPYFETETGQTFAELPEDTKNHISHRARAAALLLAALGAEAQS